MTNAMLAAMIGGWELILILAVITLPVLVAMVVLGIYFALRSKRPKNSPKPPPLPVSTVVLPRKCPKCGSELKPDVPEGLCPACLLQQGMATEAGSETKQPFTPPSLAELSKLFPQLEILGPLGKGGMGAVYKARQPALDRIVALKILAPRPGNELDFASRFSREARALAKLNHPNIVAVYDFGVVSSVSLDQSGHRPDTTPASLSYFIMEYVDGPNLRQVQQAGRLAPREALEIIPQICAALQFAHDEGVVHRDIKPENVLLDKKGRVKIADFGLAKILGQEPKDFRLTGEKDVMGTPHYMAPEQVEKPQEVDHRADIYSLGVVFYEMLTGELPLGKFQPPSAKVQVDVRLDDVVLRALEKEPERRYQQASEFKTRLETVTSNASDDPSVPKAGAIPVKKLSRLQSITLTMINVLFAAAIGAAGWGAFQVGAFFNSLFVFILIAVPVYLCLLIWRLFHGTLEYRIWKKPFDRELQKYWWVILNRWIFWLLAAWVLKLCIVPAQFNSSTYSLIRLLVWGGLASVMLLELFPGKRIYVATNLVFAAGSMFMAFQILKIHLPNRENEAVLTFPVRGEWLVVHGGNSLLINNHYQLQSQRNALDLERLVDGLEATDDRQTLESYPSWGETVYSPADGRVVSVVNDLPDNPVGKADRRNPVGNHVLIDTGRDGGRYILLAHLQRESIQVRTGDVVTENQFIARCGNSGNTSHPHLHIQVQDRPDFSVAGVRTFPILFYNAFANRSEKLPIPADLRRNDRIVSDQPHVEVPPAAEPADSDSLTNETWTPALADGQKPDLSRILDEAKDLTSRSHYEDALQRLLWLWNHSLEHDAAYSGVRQSSVLSIWIELGRRYPKAKQALLEIRDRNTRELSEGRGYSDLFIDLAAVNRELQDEDATYRLYKTLCQNDRALARQCYFYAEELLVKNGDYNICAEFMGNPKQRFDSLRQSFNMEMDSAQRSADFWKRAQQMNEQAGRTNLFSPPDTSEFLRSSAQDRFVKGTRQLIEILVATDNQEDAEAIRDAALKTLPDKRITNAVSDACGKLGKPKPTAIVPVPTVPTVRVEQPAVLIPNGPPPTTNTLGAVKTPDLIARLEAAKGIVMFTERDAALVSIAKDAAATGNAELTKKTVSQITAFTTRDDAARTAARTLAANGHRAAALEIAKTITSFSTRDEMLRELAGK